MISKRISHARIQNGGPTLTTLFYLMRPGWRADDDPTMNERELVALLCLSSWCLVIAVWLFLTMPRGCMQFVIVEFPDHTH